MSLLLLLVAQTGLFAQSKTLSLAGVPKNMDDLLALRNQQANSPEGGGLVFVAAMLMYAQDEALGMQAFTLALDQSRLTEGTIYKDFAPLAGVQQDIKNYFGKHKDHLANTYILGTKTQDNYKLPAAPYKMDFSRNKYSTQSNGDVKVFVKCSGAASPRPISLRKNDKGIWKVVEFSSLFVGVAKPKPADKL